MKRFFLWATIIIFFGLSFFIAHDGTAKHSPSFIRSVYESEKEDLQSREQFEFMQLRDPKTNSIPRDMFRREREFAKTLPTVEKLVKAHALNKTAVSTWASRGPYNQGGRTRALAFDVANANIVLAGGVSGGMWRSTNDGSSWTKTTAPSMLQSVTCLAQDTRSGKQNIWYYGTGEKKGNSAADEGDGKYLGDGIFKSTDDGVSWTQLPSTVSNTPQTWDGDFDYVWGVATDPSSSSDTVVYAAVYGGIKRSSDGGRTWTNGTGDFFSGNFTDVAVTSTGVVYATISSDGTGKGIYRSADGVTFTDITPSGWPSSYNRIVIGIAPSNENAVYFLAETPGSGTNGHSIWKYTYVSGDGSGSGGTWENRSANIPMFGGSVGNFDSQGSYDLVIKVKPDNENVVFIGGTNLYRSTDGFASTSNTTWIGGYSTANDVSSYDNSHSDMHSLAFMPGNPSVLINGNDGGISKTTNCLASTVSWTSLNNGYLTGQFYSAAVDQSANGDPVVIGGLQDNGNYFTNSTNGTKNWVKLPAGGDGGVTAIAGGKSSYYIETQNGDVLRLLLDATGNLTNFAEVKPSGATGFLFVTPYVLDPNDAKMMYLAAGTTLWRNNDLTGIALGSQSATSTNWDELTNTTLSSGNISAVAVSTTPANRVYYGTSDGKVYRLDGANSGNPTPTQVANETSGAYVNCIAIDPTNADNAIIVFSNYNVVSLYYTSDGGAHWADIAGNLEQNADGSGNGPSCRWAAILPTNSGATYYVGTSTGLYSAKSLNGTSTTWAQEGASAIGNVVVTMVVARASDGLVVAATHGNGVYSANVVTGVQTTPAVLPNQFALEQNYPNPFNPSTEIRYQVSEAGNVTLKVYDALGREIATLADERKAPGSYEASFDGSRLASGVYYYTLRAGDNVQTKQMVLVK
ncbi:MAG: T9SS type A sorting domain-containing protein [Bacteroidota bacterium]|nr:T9SS type A sorting domain-containing protein [Bacteroidota bacterium]